MIITRLSGGLGNQMFQYAVGRRIAHANNDILKLDISAFNLKQRNITPRIFELNNLNINAEIATDQEIKYFKKYKRKNGRRWFLYNKIFANTKIYARAKHYHFDPDILTLKPPVYLDGNWVTEKYFKDIEDIIRKEFAVKNPLAGRDKEIADIIANTHSVGIHIRRADYVANPETANHHGVCETEYYKKAIDFVTQKINNPHFFIFSDDHAWAKQNIHPDFPTTYVDHNKGDKGYEDMRLMSLCQHQIIANSTFSWWGAWLNANPDKIVVAPQKWFNKVKPSVDTKDVIPGSWIKM